MTHLGATARFIQLVHKRNGAGWAYICASQDQAKAVHREFTKYRKVKKDQTLEKVMVKLNGRTLLVEEPRNETHHG